MGRATVRHYVLGMEGLALLRTWLRDRDAAERRVREIHRLVSEPQPMPLALEIDVNDFGVRDGYARWVATYDRAPNPLIEAEQPVLRALIDRLPAGAALDAACGTGRHAKYLQTRGHRVIGVDGSEAMLAQARRDVPDVEFRHGDLTALPLADASVDLAVCALALTHCADLVAPLRELARVLRPGGQLLISDLHPVLCAYGSTAFFLAEDGSAGNVQTYLHLPGVYLRAFRATGLQVHDCIEPEATERQVRLMSGGAMDLAPEAFRGALLGLPIALVWQLVRA